MIRRQGQCGCNNWADVVKDLWEKYQSVVRSISVNGVVKNPDGNGRVTIDLTGDFITANDIKNVLVDTGMETDESTVTVTHDRYDAPSDVDPMPVASPTQAGVINASDYQAFVQMQSDIQDLQGVVITYQVTLPSATPTQAEITAAFTTEYPTVHLVAGIKVVDYTNNVGFQYDGSVWVSTPIAATIPIATAQTVGGVKSSQIAGEVAVNLGGTMALNGYDDITGDIANLQSGKADVSDLPSSNELVPDMTQAADQSVLTKTATGAQWSPIPSQHNTTQITVPAAGGAVTVTGITTSSTVIVSPNPTSMAAYMDSGCYCSAQSADTLTFTVDSTASTAMTVNVVWW